MIAPTPAATTTSWVQNPSTRPTTANQPRAKPCCNAALITATAPGPGERLIAHAAAKNASQSCHDMAAIVRPGLSSDARGK
jgi:hypothetical protein